MGAIGNTFLRDAALKAAVRDYQDGRSSTQRMLDDEAERTRKALKLFVKKTQTVRSA